MSRISTVYDTLNALIATLTWSDAAVKTKINRPYEIELTVEHLLRNGWALRDAGTEPEQEGQEFNLIVERHGFEFVFTREFLRQDDQTLVLDTAYKRMKEDMLILRRQLRRGSQLGIEDAVSEIELGAMSAPEEVVVGSSVFLQVACPFTVEIREDL